ncbi:hypothetical protein TREES_T100010408 [Tupaia chinensis]|uniref:Uncharacterized protein n=1 Tax=Tupaia chinensis TaxID=246437 RepID=L9LBM4_TUPCH|nr:hypothetical protein TREES_T100010408 [Tupaia chinensis]
MGLTHGSHVARKHWPAHVARRTLGSSPPDQAAECLTQDTRHHVTVANHPPPKVPAPPSRFLRTSDAWVSLTALGDRSGVLTIQHTKKHGSYGPYSPPPPPDSFRLRSSWVSFIRTSQVLLGALSLLQQHPSRPAVTSGPKPPALRVGPLTGQRMGELSSTGQQKDGNNETSTVPWMQQLGQPLHGLNMAQGW